MYILTMILTIIAVIFVSYVIGSIPTGYLIVKHFKGEDIRKIGSGSTGATNVKRVMGTKWFFAVMLLDALKGFVPVLITSLYFNFWDVWGLTPVLSAFAVIIGHSKSVFLKFTGGKSVATGVGALFALSWQVGLCVALTWGLITYFTKYVSLGSVIALALAPVFMNVFDQNGYYIWFAAICGIFVVLRHKDNIKRLINGTENKVRK